MASGVDNIKESLGLVFTMLIFIIFIGIVFIWVYNFLALSEDKMFDAENKYIDSTLTNPDVDGNYKDTYLNKIKLDNMNLNILNWFNSFQGIFIIAFLLLFLLLLILKNKKTILEQLKNMFDW